MGCMLRSDVMSLCDMYIQPEAAFDVLSHLGEMGCVQFIDMNPDLQAFQRSFILEVCRFAEMERKLRFMESEMKQNDVPIHEQKTDPKAVPLQEMAQFENILEKWENDIQEMNLNEMHLMKNYLELSELYYVLSNIGPLLGDAEIRRETLFSKKAAAASAAAAGDIGTGGRLIVTTGVVDRAKCYAFEMMLFRISHGIIYYRQAPDDAILMDPNTRKELRKVAFVAVCQGEELAARMTKVCTGFRVNTYPCPNTFLERQDLMTKLEARINDMDQVLSKTSYLRCKALRAVSRQWRVWVAQVRKAKAIYHTMNLFNVDITRKCLIGQCWVPDLDLEQVNKTLSKCSEALQSNVPSFMSKVDTNDMHPTYHRVNKFTRGFQALINAYGDSTYRELNPGLYTLVTFPFLFAMMFGDAGHGLILVACGVWMVKKEQEFIAMRSTNEIWCIFFGGRYVILLLGLFSMCTGFFYNDWFAKPIVLQKSYWINTFSVEELSKSENVDLDPAGETRSPYPWGKDPVWALAKNKIMYENSTKMKLSIIVGVIHMIFGIILSFFNHRFFKNYSSIFLQFIPELLFLTLLFFWLVVMIYLKWFWYSAKSPDPELGTSCAPQILILFIDMALLSETKPASEGCKFGYMFAEQRFVQNILLLVSVMCVPLLLFGTPIYKNRLYKTKKKETEDQLEYLRSNHPNDKKEEEHLEEELAKYSAPFSELMIHQAVHTIEFVLSTISHTASYLRLWALSLAHAQLSEMLWVMILSKLALHDHTVYGAVKLFFIFAVWAAFTVSILVVMEGLSAFLHTLRLHWVEFMSKFYAGGGWPFRPFSFKIILASEGDKTEAGCKTRGKSLL
ncbi:V-type proton ATPase 116 kDa subunit a-like [Trichoplusia ni]|uniref:V-type proton ATPase subunit a n=1 Tax=Trichoplusia ni TaxID=7111 RepID=A0A7E5VHS8_TRINI|nr:V-type proton ATPase 116 kDa subunit a-like [Trichoplusia ni]XP_026727865.1 V-type proton ATPase 116 kDa subunit a-like [Trichoplusia ni]